MARPVDTLAHVGATLARLVAEERPAWVSAASWRHATALAASLRADAARALADGPAAASRALEVGLTSVKRWRAAGGWLEGL